MKHQPLVRNFRAKQVLQVPADGFSLAVLVSCEVDEVRFPDRGPHFLDQVLLALRNHVDRLELSVDIDAQTAPRLLLVLGRNLGRAVGQVADMPDRRLHDEAFGEELRDRACLGGRLDNDEDSLLARFGGDGHIAPILYSTNAGSDRNSTGNERSNLPADHWWLPTW